MGSESKIKVNFTRVRTVLIGKIHTLVHLSQQTYQPNSRLVPGHNDKGYGTIRVESGREVYFSHEAVPDRHGFDDLRRGQSVEYTLDRESKSSATLVKATTVPANGHTPRVEVVEGNVTRFRQVVRTYRRPFQRPSITEHPLDGYPRGK
jgi:cold shock CspA family protein